MKKFFATIIFLLVFILPVALHAQELVEDTTTTYKAHVIKIVSKGSQEIAATKVENPTQIIQVEIINGDKKGFITTFENDYVQLEQGETFFLNHTVRTNGTEIFSVSDPYRLKSIIFFVALFILVTIIFGGKQGVRGLVSLVGSLALIFYVLLPGLLSGISPVLLSIGVSSLIIILGSYITHGFNRTTTTAVIGMILTIVITGILATTAVESTRLTGFADEEAIYLNFNTGGTLDFSGLLLGAILIGLLGTLYDASISQAIAVEEIYATNPKLTKKEVYKKVLRIGREHIGALVDTLAIAYVGAALPLLLFFVHATNLPFGMIINREIFATEIIRIVIGSIGVILAVPLTTFISTQMLVGRPITRTHSSHSHHHHH
ncbi:MAG: YibE/F family protein [Candidatus Pacebacteria bacterium]|nr:YibE/F family protein [Candidatus Paceibacterota bacterium]MBP9780944.1 YibE/F family protein [Candidatus Paceibacterota bacterium]